MWGKYIHSGQTRGTLDYFLVHESIKEEFIALMKNYIGKFYGDKPHENSEFLNIVNQHHFDWLSALIE